MRIEEAAAFVSISSITFGLLNAGVCWGSRLVTWIPRHSAFGAALAGGFAGAGTGVTLAGFAFFHHQIYQFWKAQKIDSAITRFTVKQVIVFSVPFFMTVLFTKPFCLLLGKNISVKTISSYAFFNAALSVYNYNVLKSG